MACWVRESSALQCTQAYLHGRAFTGVSAPPPALEPLAALSPEPAAGTGALSSQTEALLLHD